MTFSAVGGFGGDQRGVFLQCTSPLMADFVAKVIDGFRER
jgi:hypothetical protein